MSEWNQNVLAHELAQTDYSPEEAIELQSKWTALLHKGPQIIESSGKKIRWIAGVDISFPKEESPTWGIACATLWDLSTNKLQTSKTEKGSLPFPYIPGLLGFRECRLETKAILKLPRKPDVIMCDGHGIIHPRRFGEATQLGMILDVPTIGIAKNMYIGACNLDGFKRNHGEKVSVTVNNEILGYAISLKDNFKPVYVSIGHQINIETALELVIKTTLNHRQPEPLFLADQFSRQAIRN